MQVNILKKKKKTASIQHLFLPRISVIYLVSGQHVSNLGLCSSPKAFYLYFWWRTVNQNDTQP